MYCPECEEELDYLDTLNKRRIERATNRIIERIEYILYICHNEDCIGESLIYHDSNGEPVRGDPTGCY